MKFDIVTIIAPGLLGASLAAAMREKGMAGEIRIWARRAEVRKACQREDWCDCVFDDLEQSVVDADLVWIASPVGVVGRIARVIAPHLRKGAIVSDVGSTKSMIVEQCEAALADSGTHFVGSHPMAGSEKSGHEYADASLFEGMPCFVTPTDQTENGALNQILEFWSLLGMELTETTPEVHDRIVASVSHLPHLVASALSYTLAKSVDSTWLKHAGNGLADTTRIASGSVPVWKDIIQQNREQIMPMLSSLILNLEEIKYRIEAGDADTLGEILEQGKSFRDQLN